MTTIHFRIFDVFESAGPGERPGWYFVPGFAGAVGGLTYLASRAVILAFDPAHSATVEAQAQALGLAAAAVSFGVFAVGFFGINVTHIVIGGATSATLPTPEGWQPIQDLNAVEANASKGVLALARERPRLAVIYPPAPDDSHKLPHGFLVRVGGGRTLLLRVTRAQLRYLADEIGRGQYKIHYGMCGRGKPFRRRDVLRLRLELERDRMADKYTNGTVYLTPGARRGIQEADAATPSDAG